MKKKILSVLIICFLAVSMVLTGCGEKVLKDNPKTGDVSYSNGGMTVTKGDYLYFVNGYVDETSIDQTAIKDKTYAQGKVTRGAIYRTKLDNADVVKDKDGFLTNADLVVSRVVGFDNGGFYILGDTIYYATPYLMYEKDGTALSDRVEFRSININGSTKTDRQLYVTDAQEDELDWTMYSVDGKDYLVLCVNSTIYSIDASNGKVVAKVENTTSHAFYHESEYTTEGSRTSNKYKYVYYTRSADSSESGAYSGNMLCVVDITNGDIKRPTNFSVTDDTIQIVDMIENYLYYTKTDATSTSKLYFHDVDGLWDNSKNKTDLTNGISYSSYVPTGIGHKVIVTNDNGTWVVTSGATPKLVSTNSLEILKINGGYAYYLNSDVLYRFKISEPSIQEIAVGDDTTNKISVANHLDFDGQRLYVYTSYDDNYYLNYVEDTENGLVQRFVGVFDDDEKPEEPEQDEEYGEDPDVEYIPWID